MTLTYQPNLITHTGAYVKFYTKGCQTLNSELWELIHYSRFDTHCVYKNIDTVVRGFKLKPAQ